MIQRRSLYCPTSFQAVSQIATFQRFAQLCYASSRRLFAGQLPASYDAHFAPPFAGRRVGDPILSSTPVYGKLGTPTENKIVLWVSRGRCARMLARGRIIEAADGTLRRATPPPAPPCAAPPRQYPDWNGCGLWHVTQSSLLPFGEKLRIAVLQFDPARPAEIS